MNVITKTVGNAHSPEWAEKLKNAHVHNIFLDQWTAQKSRFLAVDEHGHEYPVALADRHQIADGDIIHYDPEHGSAAVLRLKLSPVLVVDLGKLRELPAEEVIRISLELGHAIGNQHWPAVVKGTKVYVPMTVDRKVMLSVMDTHHIDDITYEFAEGSEVIPYMAPHEVRRLFGGAGHESHSHVH
ncbi:MAG: urease accessory protein UreE [Muribaculaceae bacterium]|nr:urease accessory protein UreE [Muribaculaceae bacterium]